LPQPEHAHRKATWWLVAILACLSMLLARPPFGHAETVESNPNNYACQGRLSAGKPEPGNEEQQVAYAFSCNGPITGYQLQAQLPLSGVEAAPLVSDAEGKPLTDTFSCSGEVPGYAANCVGLAKFGGEKISGQFSIGTKLCAEPRVDTLLTVTWAYLEKGAITQAISGPFDLGRPLGCPSTANSGWTRLNPKPVAIPVHKKKGKKGKQGKGKSHEKPGPSTKQRRSRR
jgi:hypothetical protein